MLKKRHRARQYQTAPAKKISHDHLKTYWPYIPLAVFAVLLLAISLPGNQSLSPQSRHSDVLAYATDVNASGLLEATNNQRTSNSRSTLKLNSQLSQAAQAKANDMANRNYWSHNTPDGKTPWTFIDQAGYIYLKAGENLAYGFATSADTITGWMNSPPHRENLLGSSFSDVGFGIANTPDYQSTGPETIVVAMYGQPQVAGASASNSAASKTSKSAGSKSSKTVSQPAPAPEPPKRVTATSAAADQRVQPVTTDATSDTEPVSQKISRIQALTGGRAPWATFALGLAGGVGGAILVIKHGMALRRLLVKGERYVLRHPVFDFSIMLLVAMAGLMTRGIGLVR